jgi:hypothetical protein
LGSLFTHGDLSHDHDDDHGGGFMGDIWLTGTVGASLPIGASASVFSDVTVVTQGLAEDRHWIGIIPVIATLGVERTF